MNKVAGGVSNAATAVGTGVSNAAGAVADAPAEEKKPIVDPPVEKTPDGASYGTEQYEKITIRAQTYGDRLKQKCLNMGAIPSVYNITGTDYFDFKENALCYLASTYCKDINDVNFDALNTGFSYSGSYVSCEDSEFKTDMNEGKLNEDKRLIYKCSSTEEKPSCVKNSDERYQIKYNGKFENDAITSTQIDQ